MISRRKKTEPKKKRNPQTVGLRVIGIDPGKTAGAFAIIEDGALSQYRKSSPCCLSPYRADLIVLEEVHGDAREGKANFTFGKNYGEWLMSALIAEQDLYSQHRPAVLLVRPQVWQHAFTKKWPELRKTTGPVRKRALHIVAKKTFPKYPIKATECDAVLLAAYGYTLVRKKFNDSLPDLDSGAPPDIAPGEIAKKLQLAIKKVRGE